MASEPLIVQAIYSFKGSNNDELCFKKGDLIAVTQKDEGWWEGTLNGKTGWFPCNYVKECQDAPKPVLQQQNQYKSVVLKDLIDSEKAHVTELEGLVSNFLQPLEKTNILNIDEYKQLTGNILEVLETHQQLLKLIEAEEAKPGLEQRVGKLFMTWAVRMKNVHQTYCALHPKAVCILDKYKDELTNYMESRGATSPGVLVLTTLLSKPFRRLDKYSGMLQELERHIEECHPDRGDTQRCVSIYKEIATSCSATRRQKELELQVLTGPIKGLEGPSLSTLGDVIYMGSVAVGPQHHDRYYVLFANTLLILSVSKRLSSFIYEGKLPLSGMLVKRLEDSEQYKNAFEISTSMTETRIAVCQSKQEANHWVDLLKRQMNVNCKVGPLQAQYVPQHQTNLNQRGYCNRTSIVSYSCPVNYKATLPPSNYPSCAPYAALTYFFAKRIKEKLITRRLLRQLLYGEYLNRSNLNVVRIRHHKTECVIMTKPVNPSCRISIINCDSSSESDSENSSSSSNNSGADNIRNKSSNRIRRQNATHNTNNKDDDDDDSSSSSNPFGYIRYYNPATGTNYQRTKYESYIDYGDPSKLQMISDDVGEKKKKSLLLTSSVKLELHKQLSETSNASSCLTPKPFGACEDLVNLDGSLKIELPQSSKEKNFQATFTRQSCPTKLVGNKFNTSSLTTIYIPEWSNSEGNIKLKCDDDNDDEVSSTTTHSSSLELPVNPLPLPDPMVAEILYNFDDMDLNRTSENVLNPPSMFESMPIDENFHEFQSKPNSISNKSKLNHPSFVKPIRRRSSIQITTQDLKNHAAGTSVRRCISSKFLRMSSPPSGARAKTETFCRCCVEYHSPRSSDSGMAGSCTLNSPDLANLNVSDRTIANGLSTIFSNDNDNHNSDEDGALRLSEIEARDFERQCPCTSPFGSTPRTSTCLPIVVSVNSKTSVTSSVDLCPQMHSREMPLKSKSVGCLFESGEKSDRDEEKGGGNQDGSEDEDDEEMPIYKSGLYAHWWLKAKLPANVLRGIYMDTRSPTADASGGSSDHSKCSSRRRDHK